MPALQPKLPTIETRPNEDEIHRVMLEFPYGVYVIGSSRESEQNAMIADWVMQVSFDPRLIAVAFEQDSYTLESVRANKAFTVNLLTEQGMELAAGFLQPHRGSKIRGRSRAESAQIHNKLAGVAYRVTLEGCPVLDEALAWLDCEAERFVTVGDHVLVIARVRNGGVMQSGNALTSVYTGWEYAG